MFETFLTLIIVAGTTGAVWANDMSIQAIGGTAAPIRVKHQSVQMVSELVVMDLYKDEYTTSVDFVFINHGAATTVEMGFPEHGTGLDPSDGPEVLKETYVKDFKTNVDGNPIVAKRVLSAARPPADDYVTYWTKTVSSGANQTRHTHVQYRSPYGGGLDGTMAEYDFTGGNWHGDIAKSVLVVKTHPGAPPLPVAEFNPGAERYKDYKILKLDGPTAQRQFVRKNWQANGKFILVEKEYIDNPGK